MDRKETVESLSISELFLVDSGTCASIRQIRVTAMVLKCFSRDGFALHFSTFPTRTDSAVSKIDCSILENKTVVLIDCVVDFKTNEQLFFFYRFY